MTMNGPTYGGYSFSHEGYSIVGMKYARRGTNQVAHALARLAVTNDVDMVWFYSPPDCIHNLLQADSSALQFSYQ
jgi:hypothetical protein